MAGLSDAEMFGGQPQVYGPGSAVSGQPVTPQQQTYAAAGSPYRDPNAPAGSAVNPSYDTPDRTGAPDSFHVTPQGQLNDPNPQVNLGLTDAQMFAPTETHIAPGLWSGALGYLANLNRGLGVGDEIAAGGNAIGNMLTGKSPVGLSAFSDAMAHQRALEDGYSNDHPLAAANARGVGMGLPVVLTGGAAAPELAAGRVAALAKGAVGGAGAAYAYGAVDRGLPMERIAQANASIPLGMGLGAAGGVFAPVAQKISPDAASLADHALTGVDPIPAVVGSQDLQRIGQILKGIPLVGKPLAAAAERTSGQLDSGLQGLAARLGPSTDPLGAGGALQRGADSAVGRYQATTHALYEPVNALEANTAPIPVSNTQGAIADLFAKYPTIPGWLAKNAPKLMDVKTTLDGANGQLTFGELKAMRSDIGKMVKDHLTVGNIDQARLKTLYGAMSDDMMAGAGHLGGEEAQAALSRADTYNAAKAGRISSVLDNVIQAKSPEQAYGQVLSMAGSSNRADVTKLSQLKRSLDPDAWGDFAGGVLHQMGRDPNDGFSPAKFVTAWSKMTPAGKRALFGEVAPDLDAFARVAQQQKAASAFYNHSGSGSHTISALLVAEPVAEAAKALVGGEPMQAAGAVVGPAVAGTAGNIAARLLANPGWGRAMLRAAQTPGAAPQIIENYAQQNPNVAALARQFGARLQQSLSSGASGVAASVPTQQPR